MSKDPKDQTETKGWWQKTKDWYQGLERRDIITAGLVAGTVAALVLFPPAAVIGISLTCAWASQAYPEMSATARFCLGAASVLTGGVLGVIALGVCAGVSRFTRDSSKVNETGALPVGQGNNVSSSRNQGVPQSKVAAATRVQTTLSAHATSGGYVPPSRSQPDEEEERRKGRRSIS